MRLAAILGFLVASILPAAAFDDPKALVEAFYQPYLTDDFEEFIELKKDEPSFRSASLQALYDKDDAETPDGEMGRLDFDPFVDGQDFQITDIEFAEPHIVGELANVAVTFKNFGEERKIVVEAVLEGDEWKINDVWRSDGDYPYRLREILEAPRPE